MTLKVRAASGEDGPADDALRKLMDDEVWAAHLAACRKEGAGKLVAEAGRYADALRALGHELAHRDVERALLVFAGYEAAAAKVSVEEAAPGRDGVRNAAPGEAVPAAASGWDIEWASSVARQALCYGMEHVGDVDYEVMDRSEVEAAEDAMHAAVDAEDREAYLRAARRWASAWRRAAERVRRDRESGPDEAAGKEG
ncbi:MAG: hypothetical protein M3P49_01180 [Actinomycetota bacterium]|nr:hypothetical protein [Actinomycetota bacterium]